jgi:Icc-related predicted phosphoesterase
MIIDCISDLHGEFPKLEGGDLLIMAGDYSSNDSVPAWCDFFKWLDKQKYERKILIAGNHDNYCKQWAKSDDSIYENDLVERPSYSYLCDSGTEYKGLKIWGTPWTNWFHGINHHCKAFVDKERKIEKYFKMIPDDIDILVTHSPPVLILDQNNRGQACGNYALRCALERVKPMLHVFGHIHEQGGKQLLYKHLGPNTICVNASIMDENYDLVNKPIRIIL